MWLILIALGWLYVALMMALAQALHAEGGLLSAAFVLLGYGVAPVALLLYLLGTPMRRRARRQREASEGAEGAEAAAPSRTVAAADETAPPDAGPAAKSDPS